MHELAVTERILELAQSHAEQARASQITDIYLVIGELSSIVDDSVQFYWELLARGTPAAGATLHFRRILARLRCQVCDLGYRLGEGLTCPACGSSQIKVEDGREFYMEAIDVSLPPSSQSLRAVATAQVQGEG